MLADLNMNSCILFLFLYSSLIKGSEYSVGSKQKKYIIKSIIPHKHFSIKRAAVKGPNEQEQIGFPISKLEIDTAMNNVFIPMVHSEQDVCVETHSDLKVFSPNMHFNRPSLLKALQKTVYNNLRSQKSTYLKSVSMESIMHMADIIKKIDSNPQQGEKAEISGRFAESSHMSGKLETKQCYSMASNQTLSANLEYRPKNIQFSADNQSINVKKELIDSQNYSQQYEGTYDDTQSLDLNKLDSFKPPASHSIDINSSTQRAYHIIEKSARNPNYPIKSTLSQQSPRDSILERGCSFPSNSLQISKKNQNPVDQAEFSNAAPLIQLPAYGISQDLFDCFKIIGKFYEDPIPQKRNLQEYDGLSQTIGMTITLNRLHKELVFMYIVLKEAPDPTGSHVFVLQERNIILVYSNLPETKACKDSLTFFVLGNRDSNIKDQEYSMVIFLPKFYNNICQYNPLWYGYSPRILLEFNSYFPLNFTLAFIECKSTPMPGSEKIKKFVLLLKNETEIFCILKNCFIAVHADQIIFIKYLDHDNKYLLFDLFHPPKRENLFKELKESRFLYEIFFTKGNPNHKKKDHQDNEINRKQIDTNDSMPMTENFEEQIQTYPVSGSSSEIRPDQFLPGTDIDKYDCQIDEKGKMSSTISEFNQHMFENTEMFDSHKTDHMFPSVLQRNVDFDPGEHEISSQGFSDFIDHVSSYDF